MSKRTPFRIVLASYAKAVYHKDLNAFAALYADDIHVFDMWGSWSLQGLPAWRAMASDWFLSLGDERVEVTFDSEQSTVTENLAIGYAVLTYTAIAPDGTTLRFLSNRATMALRKTDAGWKIFHEHTSAPIEHKSLQAMLQRDVVHK